MHTIDVDRPRGLISVTFRGLLTLEEATQYAVDIHGVVAAHGMVGYAMVIDITDCPIQFQDVIQAMDAHISTMPKARSLAIVTGSALGRTQVRRLFTQPYARIVDTVAEGRAWVLDGIEPDPKHAVA